MDEEKEAARDKLNAAISEFVDTVNDEDQPYVRTWILITEQTSVELEQRRTAQLASYFKEDMRFIERRGLLEMALQQEVQRFTDR